VVGCRVATCFMVVASSAFHLASVCLLEFVVGLCCNRRCLLLLLVGGGVTFVRGGWFVSSGLVLVRHCGGGGGGGFLGWELVVYVRRFSFVLICFC